MGQVARFQKYELVVVFLLPVYSATSKLICGMTGVLVVVLQHLYPYLYYYTVLAAPLLPPHDNQTCRAFQGMRKPICCASWVRIFRSSDASSGALYHFGCHMQVRNEILVRFTNLDPSR